MYILRYLVHLIYINIYICCYLILVKDGGHLHYICLGVMGQHYTRILVHRTS